MINSDDDLYAPQEHKDDSVVIAVKVPKHLREEWKAHCHAKGADMSVVLRRFIERELQKAKGQK